MTDRVGIIGEMRKELLSRLDRVPEIEDDGLYAIIDDLILSTGRRTRLSLREKEDIRRELYNSVRKLDVLQDLIDDEKITEIMVNGWEKIFVEKNGRITRLPRTFASPERLADIVQQIAGRCDRTVNEQKPIADALLGNGDRVNIVLPPVSIDGPVVTIRRFPKEAITMERLTALKTITWEAADFLKDLVAAGYSILVGGGTSTGKTTFLNALSAFIPKDERIVTIEDNAELQITGIDNLVRLEARDANLEGSREITIRDLIKTALRMRPNRIIIGEVRGREAGDFLTALNTGHSGSLGSAHANSTRDMTGRLEAMVRMGSDLPIPVIRGQIASGVEIIVHLTRDASGARRVEEICEITGFDGAEISMQTLYGQDASGTLRKRGELYHTEKRDRYHEYKKHFEDPRQARLPVL